MQRYHKFNTLSVLLLATILLWAPIIRGGYTSSIVLVIFILSTLMFLSMLLSEDYSRARTWCLVWLIFTACLFFQPYLPSIIKFTNYSNESLFNIDRLYVWIFFSSMWVVVLRSMTLNRNEIKWILYSVILASSFQALYGIFHHLSGAESVLGLWTKSHFSGGASGTFVNRNHFAGMLAMCWPITVAALTSQTPLVFHRLKISYRVFFAGIYSIFMVVALILSESRMGIAAAVIGILASIFIMVKQKISSIGIEKRGVFFLPLLCGVLALLIALWFGVEDIAIRYTRLEGGDSRIDIWSAMMHLPLTAWILGIGPGSFESVFHLVQPIYLTKNFAYAHNDYLQFLLTFGLLFSLLIVLIMAFYVYKELPRGDFSQRAGCIGALTAVALHSIVDCNLQIPGSAVVAWVAFGLLMNPNIDASAQEKEPLMRKSRARKGGVSTGSHQKKSGLPKNKQEWLAFLRFD